MKKTSQFLLIGSLGLQLLFNTACSVEAKGVSDNPPPIVFNAYSIVGTWKRNCVSENGLRLTEQLTMQQNGDFEVRVEMFMNETCAGTPVSVYEADGTYIVRGPSTQVSGTMEVDIIRNENGQTSTDFTFAKVESSLLTLPRTSGGNELNRYAGSLADSNIYVRVQ